MYEFPSLFKFLKNNGYTRYWLSSIKPPDNFPVPWSLYEKFYGVDNWIKFQDLNFTGKLVGFGPAPPDQYSLNFALEKIKRDQNKPYSLFYITQNSHNPFYAPDSIAEDWKLLNTGESIQNNDINFLDLPEKINYLKSIKYELETITQLILNKGNSNDLFVVIGDHQPPGLVDMNSKKGTPIHIISQNKKIIEAFQELGFTNGLQIKIMEETMTHAGLYSALIRSLVLLDSTASNLPTFLPNGWEY